MSLHEIIFKPKPYAFPEIKEHTEIHDKVKDRLHRLIQFKRVYLIRPLIKQSSEIPKKLNLEKTVFTNSQPSHRKKCLNCINESAENKKKIINSPKNPHKEKKIRLDGKWELSQIIDNTDFEPEINNSKPFFEIAKRIQSKKLNRFSKHYRYQSQEVYNLIKGDKNTTIPSVHAEIKLPELKISKKPGIILQRQTIFDRSSRSPSTKPINIIYKLYNSRNKTFDKSLICKENSKLIVQSPRNNSMDKHHSNNIQTETIQNDVNLNNNTDILKHIDITLPNAWKKRENIADYTKYSEFCNIK